MMLYRRLYVDYLPKNNMLEHTEFVLPNNAALHTLNYRAINGLNLKTYIPILPEPLSLRLPLLFSTIAEVSFSLSTILNHWSFCYNHSHHTDFVDIIRCIYALSPLLLMVY